MKYLGPPQSGSQAATVASRNRFGQYYRTRAIPVQPRGSRQVDNRNTFGALSAGWRQLTDPQREAWITWAGDHPRVNSLGQTVILTGLQAFLAINQRLARNSLATITGPPGDVAPWGNVVTAIAVDASAQTVAVTFAGQEDEQSYELFAGPPRSAGVSFEGRYAFISSTIDEVGAGSLPAGPEYVAVWGALTGAAGKVIFFRVVQFNTAGDAYPPYDFKVTVVA